MELYEAIIDQAWQESTLIDNGYFQLKIFIQKYFMQNHISKKYINKDKYYFIVICTDTQESIAHLFMDVIGLQMKDSTHGQKYNYFQE